VKEQKNAANTKMLKNDLKECSEVKAQEGQIVGDLQG
jgi:hypothetical protein